MLGYIGDCDWLVYVICFGVMGDILLVVGEMQNEYIVWFELQVGFYNLMFLVYGDVYYMLFDCGFLIVYDVCIGIEIYSKQCIVCGVGVFMVSLWVYNGKIFVFFEDGDIYVIEFGDLFEVFGMNLFDEMMMVLLVIVDGSFFVCMCMKFYCFSLEKQVIWVW